ADQPLPAREMVDLRPAETQVSRRRQFGAHGGVARNANAHTVRRRDFLPLRRVELDSRIRWIETPELAAPTDAEWAHVVAAVVHTFLGGNRGAREGIVKRNAAEENMRRRAGNRDRLGAGQVDRSGRILVSQFRRRPKTLAETDNDHHAAALAGF